MWEAAHQQMNKSIAAETVCCGPRNFKLQDLQNIKLRWPEKFHISAMLVEELDYR